MKERQRQQILQQISRVADRMNYCASEIEQCGDQIDLILSRIPGEPGDGNGPPTTTATATGGEDDRRVDATPLLEIIDSFLDSASVQKTRSQAMGEAAASILAQSRIDALLDIRRALMGMAQ